MTWLRILAVGALAILAGCGLTTQGDAIRDALKAKAAGIMDTSLDNSVWFTCNGASMGSVKRKFGQTQEAADAYRLLCSIGQNDADLIGRDE